MKVHLAPAIIIGVALASAGTFARADTYDYAIERFEADGNVHGPKDGVPDLLEEFGDGVMGPLFSAVVGSSTEAGGALHLHSPGAVIGIPGVTPTNFETSAVTSGSPPILQVGSGDMALRIVLPSQAILGNDGVNLLLSSFGSDGLYYAGISIVNFNSALAERSQPPITPGTSILSHQEEINYLSGNEQLILEHEPIDLGTVSWPLILELRYDDATESITTAYSLDGGATFATPFNPLPLESAQGNASAYIAAVAHAGDCPAGLGIESARFGGLGVAGKGRISMRLSFGGNRRGFEPLRLVLTDEGAGGATLLDARLPDTLISTPKCGPSDGWSSVSRLKFSYRNDSDALPPDCVPGSAQGLKKVDLRWTGTNHVKLKVANASLPPLVGPIRFAFYRGSGPVNECDGFVGEADCIVRPQQAKCSSGP